MSPDVSSRQTYTYLSDLILLKTFEYLRIAGASSVLKLPLRYFFVGQLP